MVSRYVWFVSALSAVCVSALGPFACTPASTEGENDASSALDASTASDAPARADGGEAYPCPATPALGDVVTLVPADGFKVSFKTPAGFTRTDTLAGESSDTLKIVRFVQAPFTIPDGRRYPERVLRLDVEQIGPFKKDAYPFQDGTETYAFGTGFSTLGEENGQSLDAIAGELSIGGETVRINRQLGNDQARFRVKVVSGDDAYAVVVRTYIVAPQPVLVLDLTAICTPMYDTLGLAVIKSLTPLP